MKTEDFKKTIEDLQEEIKRNNEKIAVSDERTVMAKINQFEYKFGETLFFSTIYYLGLFALFTTFTSNGIMASITNTISVESLGLIITGSSLVIGTIGRKIFEWRFKTKERFKSFTTAKTQYEKILEEIKYAVELERANNRNKAIQKTIDSLSSNQSILNSLSNWYDINEKNVPQTIEESKKTVDKFSILLNEKYNELDVLTTQKVLHEWFWKIRTKGKPSIDIIVSAMMGGLLSMMYVNTPFIMMGISKTLTYNSLPSALMTCFAPLVAGITGVSVYMIKKNKDYMRVFNNLNNDLNEKALPGKIKKPSEEKQDIDDKIESKIREISIAGAQLQEQKRIMESFAENNAEKEKILETLAAAKHIPSSEHLMLLPEGIIGGAKINSQIKEKRPALVLRRKPNNTQNPRK